MQNEMQNAAKGVIAMEYDGKLVVAKLARWERYLNHYALPPWDDIPNVGLYMEQVLVLLKEYLDYLPPELKEEQFITAATINNYVQKKFMPEPIKKRYYRVHIAYMIMICTLKQSLCIATLQKLIPNGIEEDEVREIYTAYAHRHRLAVEYFVEQVKMIAEPLIYQKESEHAVAVEETRDFITVQAVVSSFAKLLAEKLLLLEGKKYEDMDEESLK